MKYRIELIIFWEYPCCDNSLGVKPVLKNDPFSWNCVARTVIAVLTVVLLRTEVVSPKYLCLHFYE